MANTLSTVAHLRRSRSVNTMETSALGQATVLGHAMADVAVARERTRHVRLRRVGIGLVLVGGGVAVCAVVGHPVQLGRPGLPPSLAPLAPFARGFLLV